MHINESNQLNKYKNAMHLGAIIECEGEIIGEKVNKLSFSVQNQIKI